MIKILLRADLADVKDGIAVLRSAELKTAAHQLKGLLGLIPEIQAIEDEAERRSALDNDFKPKAQQVIDHAQVRISRRLTGLPALFGQQCLFNVFRLSPTLPERLRQAFERGRTDSCRGYCRRGARRDQLVQQKDADSKGDQIGIVAAP